MNLGHLYHQMARIRAFEAAVQQLWERGLISGEMHQSSGEEAVVAGVLAHFRQGDALSLAHRTSAGMVVRGVELRLLFSELLGHEQGLCRGRGGHMHLFSKAHLAASSGIVGASLPVGAGLALSAKRLRPGAIAVAFTGDGALNQGMALESLNLARVWRLPLLVVCIDNGWAITTKSKEVTAGSLVERVRAFGWTVDEVDGNDVGAVFETAETLVEGCRTRQEPACLYAKCPRLDGHLLGDPLLKQSTQPTSGETRRTVTRVVSSALKSGGGGLVARAGSLIDVVGTMSKARGDAKRRDKLDPLVVARRKLQQQDVSPGPLDEAAAREVAAAVAEALAEVEEPSCAS